MSRSRSAWALVLTSVAFFMGALDSLVVITALPAVHKEIGGSLSSLEWALNAYTVAVPAARSPAPDIGRSPGAGGAFISCPPPIRAPSSARALGPGLAGPSAARTAPGR